MKMAVTFSENTTSIKPDFAEDSEHIKAKFGEVSEIRDGYPQEEVDRMVADAEQQGYEAGKQDEYDRFWGSAMESNSFVYRFSGACWNDETFTPTRNINPTGNAYNMLHINDIGDLRGILEARGVTLDLSNCTGRVDNMFSYSRKMTAIPYLDLRQVTTTYAETFSGMFNSCESLHTIECMHLRDDGSQVFKSTFNGCSALENLTIQGKIGTNGFNVTGAKKLSHDSLMSIINALQDKSTDTSGTTWTVTLGWMNLDKLSEEEKAIMDNKGWNYS